MNLNEKNALLQFMGQIYGETKKHDQMLVGRAKDLKPTSDIIKNAFEQTLRTPVQGEPQPQPPPVPVPVATPPVPPVAIPVTTPMHASELAALPQAHAMQSVPEQNSALNGQQLEFDLREMTKLDKVIDLLERQNSLLRELNKNLNSLLIDKKNNVKIKSNGKNTTGKEPG